MLSPKELEALIGTRTNPDDRFYKGVLYGEFGKRKTTTACRCIRNKGILLHVDRGWNVVLNHPEEFSIESDGNIIPLNYEGLSQVTAVVDAITSEQEPFNQTDLIIVDTVSQMQERYIDFLNENFTIFGRESAKPITGKKDQFTGKPLQEVSITGLPDYHLTRNKMRPIIDLLVHAPVDVLFLAHVREPSPIEISKGILARRPNLTDAVWKIIARDATFIGYMEERKNEYTIDFQPTAKQHAKSQIATLTDKKIKAEELPKYLWDWKKGN